MPRFPTLVLILGIAGSAAAQQLIGYVNTHDAEVTGASDVLNGRAVLTGSAGVTARDHTAPITLGRGGTVRVCQTSVLHVTESKSADIAAPLLFSLERGAVEIQMNSALNDSIMTPDLRFTIVNKGPLDLRLRVTRNGDTCVESRGPYAPTLNISDAFGERMYQVAAGQHVLFEHGNLHEVVDKEQYPCGCPEPNGMSVADALLASGGAKPALPVPAPATPQPVQASAPATAMVASVPAPAPPAIRASAPPTPAPQPDAQDELQSAERAAAAAAVRAAEAKHPFPAAISEGLAEPAEAVPSAPGAPRAQITDSLSYNAAASAANPAAAAKGKKAAKGKAATPAPPPVAAKPTASPKPKAEQPNDLVHVVGRFFRRLFGG
ncbi:MAG: nuclease [Acidobacteriota bacterium]|nr:nuclease [Acidobacteriota bacterium]